MISLFDIKRILTPEKSTMPSDDFRIIQSWAEYDETSGKNPENKNLNYLCYELEVMNPDTGERIHLFKAIKFARVIRLPANAKQSTAFMNTCELKLQQPNVRRMEVRSSTSSDMLTVDQKILVRNALRQRPDRIILGETRDGSIVDLISAMSSGHDGSISTIHANDPENMCNVRIPILYSMNKDVNFSEKSIAMQISEAIQVIVQIKRFPDGSRKISQISCVEGLDENDKVKVVDIFRYDKNKKGFIATGYVPRSIIEKIRSQNIPFQESIFEVKRGEENA